VQGRSYINASFLSRTSREIEERQGYINGAFPGSPVKVLNRFHLSAENIRSPLGLAVSDIELGALTKKDPGEQSISNFSTYYAGINIPALETHFVIGDYQMESAEGLIFWRASAFGKGSDVIAPARKNGGGVHPYFSSDENSYFRGIGASIGTENMKIQIIYSHKAINATIDTLGYISAIDNSGLFRTESEQRRHNSSYETLIGFRGSTYLLEGLKIGGTYYHTQFADPLLLKGKNGEFASELCMRGMDVSFTNRDLDVFSECAFDRANAIAVIAGITYEPISELAFEILARDYPSTFQSIHGNAFGESSGQVQNENGLYLGIKAKPLKWLCLSSYYDQFEHPQPTYLLPAPTQGNDLLALAEIKLSEQYETAFQYKRKDVPSVRNENDQYGRTIKQICPRIQQNYRLTSEFNSSQFLRLSSRIEWVTVQYSASQTADLKNAEQGMLMSQAIKCRIQPITIQARLAFFETDSYDSAIYEFEDDVPGAYSDPALFGCGIRWYFILRYQIFSKMYIAAKYAQTIKEGAKTIGTGNDEISGDSQSIMSIQVEIRF